MLLTFEIEGRPACILGSIKTPLIYGELPTDVSALLESNRKHRRLIFNTRSPENTLFGVGRIS